MDYLKAQAAPTQPGGRLSSLGACRGLSSSPWAASKTMMFAPSNRQFFGFHEIFHSSVILGHSTSMVLDILNVLRPCTGLC